MVEDLGICTICGEKLTKQLVKLEEKWNTESDLCMCELLNYVMKLETISQELRSANPYPLDIFQNQHQKIMLELEECF